MSALDFWTLAAIAVLVLVPPAIFVWFLFDAVQWLRSHPPRRRKRSSDAGDA